LHRTAHTPHLHSFPTRRSSDLYHLTDDAGGRFAIDPSTGIVTVADGSLLNYESATSHNITVRASDGTLISSSRTFTIAVTNAARSEEHTSELQSLTNLVCRLLL